MKKKNSPWLLHSASQKESGNLWTIIKWIRRWNLTAFLGARDSSSRILSSALSIGADKGCWVEIGYLLDSIVVNNTIKHILAGSITKKVQLVVNVATYWLQGAWHTPEFLSSQSEIAHPGWTGKPHTWSCRRILNTFMMCLHMFWFRKRWWLQLQKLWWPYGVFLYSLCWADDPLPNQERKLQTSQPHVIFHLH